MIRITQFRNKCIGCNACVEVAPYRWRISKKDGKSVLLQGTEKKGVFSAIVADDEYHENTVAARMCPTNIIKVEHVKRK
ncbi:MAG: ferredoxin [Bacteroidota bacterium]|jgi:ferredoxin